MVAAARALAPNPKLLLLDEASLGLGPSLLDDVFSEDSSTRLLNRMAVSIRFEPPKGCIKAFEQVNGCSCYDFFVDWRL